MISMRRGVLLAFALIMLAACDTAFAPNTRVVFSGERAEDLVDNCLWPRTIASSDRMWTPSYLDVVSADRILRDVLPQARFSEEGIALIRRQYVGVTINNRHFIYVRGVDEDATWNTDPCASTNVHFGAWLDLHGTVGFANMGAPT